MQLVTVLNANRTRSDDFGVNRGRAARSIPLAHLVCKVESAPGINRLLIQCSASRLEQSFTYTGISPFYCSLKHSIIRLNYSSCCSRIDSFLCSLQYYFLEGKKPLKLEISWYIRKIRSLLSSQYFCTKERAEVSLCALVGIEWHTRIWKNGGRANGEQIEKCPWVQIEGSKRRNMIVNRTGRMLSRLINWTLSLSTLHERSNAGPTMTEETKKCIDALRAGLTSEGGKNSTRLVRIVVSRD